MSNGVERWSSPVPLPTGFPQPGQDFFHGPAGEAALAAAEYTEADPVGVYGCLLAESAAHVGRRFVSWCSGQRIEARLFVVLVGPTSNGRKGTAGGMARQLMVAASGHDESMLEQGFASGEALVESLAGRDDERLLVEEPELASVLTAGNREGSILSAIFRTLWDGQSVSHRRAGSELVAESPHVCLVGHITPDELNLKLRGVDRSNGYANRLLPVAVHRRQRLTWFGPPGGLSVVEQADVAPCVDRLRDGLCRTDGPSVLPFAASGRRAWVDYYDSVEETVDVVARRDMHILRVALLLAVLDGSESINAGHVAGGRALADYADATWWWALGENLLPGPAQRVLAIARGAGASGATRTELHNKLSNHMSADDLRQNVALLVASGHVVESVRPTGGRPCHVVHAVESAPAPGR
jgi:hypothetical protein